MRDMTIELSYTTELNNITHAAVTDKLNAPRTATIVNATQ